MQNVSLPEELQKILDQRIGMGIIGQNMGQFMQYQTAQAIPELAKGAGSGGGIASEAVGLGAGVALGQVLAQNLQQGLQAAPAAAAAAATGVFVRPQLLKPSISPGYTVRPLQSITQPSFGAGRFAPTASIRPSRTNTDPPGHSSPASFWVATQWAFRISNVVMV